MLRRSITLRYGVGQLKHNQTVSNPQCLCAAVHHCREFITLPHCCLATYQTLEAKQWQNDASSSSSEGPHDVNT